MRGTGLRAVVLALTGGLVVLVLALAASSAAFPPPSPGEALSILVPPPVGPAEQADEGQVTDLGGGRDAAENRYTAGLRWYEIFFIGVLVVFAVCLLLAPLVVLGLLRLPGLRRRPRAATGGVRDADETTTRLAEAVEAAVERVEQGETREAVVACWLLLERAATAAGSPARGHETTTEYAARLAAEQLVSGAALTQLAGLYREARFSAHPVSAEMRGRARASLGVLQRELTGGVRL